MARRLIVKKKSVTSSEADSSMFSSIHFISEPHPHFYGPNVELSTYFDAEHLISDYDRFQLQHDEPNNPASFVIEGSKFVQSETTGRGDSSTIKIFGETLEVS